MDKNLFTTIRVDCLDAITLETSFDFQRDSLRQHTELPKQAHLYRWEKSHGQWEEIAEMPADFDRLHIDFLDAKVMHLLSQWRSSVMSRIKLTLLHETPPQREPGKQICVPATLTALRQLLPLIGRVEVLFVTSQKELLIFRDHFPDSFYGIERLEYRVEDEWNEQSLELLWGWLCAPRPNGEKQPKLLKFQVFSFWDHDEIIEQIKKRFSSATQLGPPFNIDFWLRCSENGVDEATEQHVENATTGERLSVENFGGGSLIRRFHPGLEEEEEEAKKKKMQQQPIVDEADVENKAIEEEAVGKPIGGVADDEEKKRIVDEKKSAAAPTMMMAENKQREIILRCPALTAEGEQRCREKRRREFEAIRNPQSKIMPIGEEVNKKRFFASFFATSSAAAPKTTLSCSDQQQKREEQQIRALESDNLRLQAELVEARLANLALEKAKSEEVVSKKAEVEELKQMLSEEAATSSNSTSKTDKEASKKNEE